MNQESRIMDNQKSKFKRQKYNSKDKNKLAISYKLAAISISFDLFRSIKLAGVLLALLLLASAQSFAQEVTPVPISGEELTEEVLGIEDLNLESLDKDLNLAEDQEDKTSAKLSVPTYVTSLLKSNYQIKEKINIIVKNLTEEESQNLDLLIENIKGKGINALVTKEFINSELVFTINPEVGIVPGKYRVKVVNTTNNQILSEQDFTWGVLAINTNKSIYLPGENAKIAMAVLDNDGQMVCDAKVELEIKAPWGQISKLSTEDGNIRINQECNVHDVTEKPDYEADFQVTDIGRYTMSLTATTHAGTYTIKDRFEVREAVPFEVERITATRLYPPENYPVRLKIKANEAFSGKIVEAVPQEFQIKPVVDSSVISYTSINSLPESFDPFKEHGIGELLLPYRGDFPVTLGFGQQIDGHGMELAYKRSGIDGHDGIDFALPRGTEVVAVDGGKVILAQENWTYGHTVVIQHSWGRTYYGHLDEIRIPEGIVVVKGQILGISGNTGLSTGPHLHFSLKPNTFDPLNLYYGKVDPAPFLGLASYDKDLSHTDFPLSAKALVWNVNVAKGATFEIGYDYKAPNKSPYFYTIGQLQFIASEIDTSTKSAKFDVPLDYNGETATGSGFVLAAGSESLVLGEGEASTSGELSAISFQPSDNTGKELNVSDIVSEELVTGQVVFQEIRQWQIAADSVNDISVQRNTIDVSGTSTQNSPQDFTEFGSLENTFVRNLNTGKLSSKMTAGSTYDSKGLSGAVRLENPSLISFQKDVGSESAATKFSWESWEYNGAAGGPNEFKVISRNTVTLDGRAKGTRLQNTPSNINKTAPFITGIRTSQIDDLGSATAIAWLEGPDILQIERGSGINGTVKVDVVTVEFTGSNWKVFHGDSKEVGGDSGNISLTEFADGTTSGGGQVGNFGNAAIFHQYRSGPEITKRDSDLLATYKPGGANSVNYNFHPDKKDELSGRHFIHVLKNDVMSVTRLTDSGDKINDSNLNISSANLKDLYSTSSQLSCNVSGQSDFGSGIRNGRITSTGNFEHSSIGTAKDTTCEIQIIDLFNVKSTQDVTLNQIMRHGKSLSGGNEQGFIF